MKVQDLNKTILEYDTTGKPLSAMPTEELKAIWSKCDCKDHTCSKCEAVKHNLLQRKVHKNETKKPTEKKIVEGKQTNNVIASKLKICAIMCEKLKDAIEYPTLNVAFRTDEADKLYESLSEARKLIHDVRNRMLDNRQHYNRMHEGINSNGKFDGHDFGSSDWNAVLNSVDKEIEHMGGSNLETIKKAALETAQVWWKKIGCESPEDAAEKIVQRWHKRNKS